MGVKLVLTTDYLKVDLLPQAKHLMLMKFPDFFRRVSPPLVRIPSLDLVKVTPPPVIHLAFTVLFCL